MRVVFVCDAGPKVGGGHVMRCLTLARAMERRGVVPIFMETPPVTDLLNRFAPDMGRAHARDSWLVEATASTDGSLVVFDHYGLRGRDHAAAAANRPMLVMDDMADRELYADLVVNSGLVHTAKDYEPLTPTAPRLLLGPAYAPLRPEFAAARAAALTRRGGPVEQIVVTLGLGDHDLTEPLLRLLRPLAGAAAVEVILPPSAAARPAVEALARDWPRLTLRHDVRDMAGLYASADLAIGAGGMSAWERCVVGLPSLNVVLAANQAPNAAAMGEAGAALTVEIGDPDWQFRQALEALLQGQDLRAEMSCAAAALCDGLGAERVADAALELLA